MQISVTTNQYCLIFIVTEMEIYTIFIVCVWIHWLHKIIVRSFHLPGATVILSFCFREINYSWFSLFADSVFKTHLLSWIYLEPQNQYLCYFALIQGLAQSGEKCVTRWTYMFPAQVGQGDSWYIYRYNGIFLSHKKVKH